MPTKTHRSKTTPALAQSQARQVQAIDMRIAGKSFDQIAQALGIQPNQARKLVMDEMDRRAAYASSRALQLRHIEDARLDKLLAACWPQALAGDPKALSNALKIMERRARLIGLDAPERQEVSGPNGQPLQAAVFAVPLPMPSGDQWAEVVATQHKALSPPEED